MTLLLVTILPLLLLACIKKPGDGNNSLRKKTMLLIISTLSSLFTSTQEKVGQSTQELSDKLSNPVASLIRVPFQNNVDYDIGTYHGFKSKLNFQRVIPISLSPKMNLITQYIIPIVDQHDVSGDGKDQYGLSNATISGFFSSAASKNGLIWGAGPAFLFPIGTNDFLSRRKWEWDLRCWY